MGWTQQEIEYLVDNLGRKSIATIAKKKYKFRKVKYE
jgi:hypothetical protein